MYAVVLDVLAVEATLVPEVLLKLLVDVVSHRLPAETHGDIQSLRPRRMTARDFSNAAEMKWGYPVLLQLYITLLKCFFFIII